MQLIRCRKKPNSRAGAHKGKILLNDFHTRKIKKYPKQEPILPVEPKVKEHFLCVGDLICLYSEDTQGYVYNCQSSSVHNGIQIYHQQCRDKPLGIPHPAAVVFRVCIPHRYKLTKKYRRLLEDEEASGDEHTEALEHAKTGATAEHVDNVQEQKRNEGRRVCYGEAIQLKHEFTGKFVHISTTQTSKIDKNKMTVSLESHNSKHCRFRIIPRYKVRSEGESVQIMDQVVLESVKSPGNYLHASDPTQTLQATWESEFNLGIEMTTFTVIRYYKPQEQHANLILCGSALQLFHKDLEAYLSAEGLFEDQITETVHLRLREVDPLVPRTMFPSTSAITYWQIEDEHSILHGGPLTWGQQVRFRHMTTRHYLCANRSCELYLTSDATDPKTVFRLHPLVKVSDEVTHDSYARIEHVLTGSWLHGQRNDEYSRQYSENCEESNSMACLRWDGANLRQIKTTQFREYHDAYTLQRVEDRHSSNLAYAAGMVPFLLNVINERRRGELMVAKKSAEIQKALGELKEFMKLLGRPHKQRQKLLRNLRIVDLLVVLLQLPVQEDKEEAHMVDIFRECYDVLRTYMTGPSRKNSLYLAKYIGFFHTQIKGTIGLDVVDTVIELLRDSRDIIERIPHYQIDAFIDLLQYEHYKYLDLLGVLCVCKDEPLHDNQNYITQTWLKHKKCGLYLTERGQIINRLSNVIYVSTDDGRTWISLHQMVNPSWEGYDERQAQYLEHQLDLYGKLCFGRNQGTIHSITLELGLLTWEEVFLCLQQDILPDTIRAKYCQLVNELFINVGRNYSIFSHQHTCIIYDELVVNNPAKELDFMRTQLGTELDAIFPVVSDWITDFLKTCTVLVAANVGRNMLIGQMLFYLVSFGYYNSPEDMNKLIPFLLDMLDGKTDRPFHIEKDRKKGYLKDTLKKFQYYTNHERFKQSEGNDYIASIKIRVLRIVELILAFQDRMRLRALAALFKAVRDGTYSEKQASVLRLMFVEDYDPFCVEKGRHKQRKVVLKCLKQMFDGTCLVDGVKLTPMFMDLLQYECNTLARSALQTLDMLYSTKRTVFQRSVSCLILTSVDSVRVHRQLAYHLPRLKRYIKTRPTDQETENMAEAIDSLMELFDTRCKPDSYEKMTQMIMMNHGMPGFVFEVLALVSGNVPMDKYKSMELVARKLSMLMTLLCKDNPSVHQSVFEHLDIMIAARGVEREVAETLIQVFIKNESLCIRVAPRYLERLVQLACSHTDQVPQYLTLLTVLVKPHAHREPLKRNQTYVMKYVIQCFSKVTFPLDKKKPIGEQLMVDSDNEAHITYIVKLTNLLATCAQGENHYIESICQTILPIDLVLLVLSDPLVHFSVKTPFVKFFHEVYVNSSISLWDSDIIELFNNRSVQILLEMTTEELHGLSDSIQTAVIGRTSIVEALQLDQLVPFSSTDDERACQAAVFFLFDAFLPFVQTLFSKFHDMEGELNDYTTVHVNQLVYELLTLSDVIRPCVTEPYHLRQLITAVVAVTSITPPHHGVMQIFLYNVDEQINQLLCSTQNQENSKSTDDELKINNNLSNMARHCRDLYLGQNTVHTQLNYNKMAVRNKQYSCTDELVTLPLGQEFQQHIQCFLTPHKSIDKQYQLANRLITHLGCTFHGKEELDIKGLKLLRSMVYNEVVKLPEGWNEAPLKHTVQIRRVSEIQKTLADLGVMVKVIPLLGSKSDRIFDETLAFLCTLLFNANTYIQESIMKYFHTTKEEVFFAAIRSRLQAVTCSIKERRSLRSHQKPSPRTGGSVRKISSAIHASTQRVLGLISHMEAGHHTPQVPARPATPASTPEDKSKPDQPLYVNPKLGDVKGDMNEQAAPQTCTAAESYDYMSTDRGQIELVLRLLAMLCDGQYRDLQNFLREQPENLKTFNLVSEVMLLLGAVYSNIDEYTIEMAIQIYDTLIEFTTGNQANRMVLLSSKVIDGINYILRSKHFRNCPTHKVEALYQSIGTLLYALIEENGPEEIIVGREVKDTIDKEALINILTNAYQASQTGDQLADSEEGSEVQLELGFTYYLVLMRLYDIDPRLSHRVRLDAAHKIALHFYRENCLSIEILKDSHLQKINFRVLSKRVLREEVKEKLKWNVNRTSPSNRIRDFMAWSRDILVDVRNQRRILNNRFATFLTRKWLLWNQSVIALSLIINILMLLTWDAPLALEKVPNNATVLPDALFDSTPVIRYVQYSSPVVLVLSSLHNLMSFTVLITYFISNHPRLPDLLASFRKMCRKKPTGASKAVHVSRLEVYLFSPATFYYLIFFALSMAGTVWSGYLLAFHLLHIVNINQLLGGVIKALTKNSKSLMWVAILGMVIFYLYSLVAFAFLRNIFDPSEELYCATLWQCTVTVLRYGLIGDYEEKFYIHPLLSSFANFSYLSLYQVSFYVFISTIGLNVIFGIIVDTFSEHRELKWAAEADMRDSCFICGRPSYDFEHSRQGFTSHVKQEHNMWAYIFFFIHLDDTKSTDHTALDLYVNSKLKSEDNDFFPVNQAMCLSNTEDENTETKIDQLLNCLILLVRRQIEKESERRQVNMKEEQAKWHQTHRQRLLSASRPRGRHTVNQGAPSTLSP